MSTAALIAAADAALLGALLYFVLRPWVYARRRGVKLLLQSVVDMRFRHIPPIMVVDAYLMQRRRGEEVPIRVIQKAWETHHEKVTDAASLARFARAEHHSLTPGDPT